MTPPRPKPGAERTADVVARHIRTLIFDGELVAGQRLPQDDIAEAVGVSRIPIREAIIALEREGWVRVENHRGAFVNPLDENAITDRFALFARFYAFAAARAMARMDDSGRAELAALADAVGAARTADDMEHANSAYIATLVRLAGSNRLKVVLRSIDPIVPGNFFASVPDSIAIQQTGIASLQQAIETNDPDEAERIIDALEVSLARSVIALTHERRAAKT